MTLFGLLLILMVVFGGAFLGAFCAILTLILIFHH